MSSSHALVRNSAVLLTGTIVAKAIVFASYLVLTRQLGTEGFGHYVYLFTGLAFFELLADAGLDPLLVREGTVRPDDLRRSLGDALLVRSVLTAAALAVAWFAIPRFSARPEDGPLVLLAGATLWATNRRPSLRSVLEVPARIRLRMELPTILGAVTEIVALVFLCVLASRVGLAGAIAAQPLAQIPMLVLYSILLAPGDRPIFAPDLSRLTRLLLRAAPLLGALALNIVLVRADVLFLERLHGSREVGIYAAPVRLVEIANLLPALLMTSLYPLLVSAFERDREEAGRFYRESIRFLMLGLVPFVLAQILFAGPIVQALYGSEFAPSAKVLPWLALSELLLFLDIVLGARLLAEHEERRNLILVGAAAAFNVVANAAVVPEFGARGAAVVTIGSYAVRLGVGLLFSRTREAVAQAFVASRSPWIAGGVALAAAAGVRAAGTLFELGGFSDVAAGVAAFAVYAISLDRLGGVRSSDWAFARQLFTRERS